MFERFTRDARTAVVRAQDEARTLGDRTIGTQHLLLGVAGTGDDPAARALRDSGLTAGALRRQVLSGAGAALDADALATLGIDLERVRQATEEHFGSGALDPAPIGRSPRGHIPFSANSKKALELAVRSAQSSPSTTISTGHLLIGIIDVEKGLGARALAGCGVDLARLRAAVIGYLSAEAA